MKDSDEYAKFNYMIDPTLFAPLYDALTVARRGSVAAAAAELHKTPSAVSQQLRRLEATFDIALFEKAGRGIRPSAGGELVLPALTRLFDEAESVLALLAELSGKAVTIVRLAVGDYLGRELLAPVMRRVAEEGSSVRFEIVTAHSGEALDLLERGEVDLAIVTTEEVRPGQNERHLCEQGFCWVAPRRSPRGRAGTLRAEAPPHRSSPDHGHTEELASMLATEPLVRLAAESVGRRLFDEYLAAHGVRPSSTIDVPSVSLLLGYVEAGVGVGLAPTVALAGVDEDALEIHPAAIRPLPVKLVMRPGHPSTTVAQELVDRIVAEGIRLAETLERAGL